MKVKLANPRGFCAGVNRAINIIEQVMRVYGVPVYVKHALVHNDYVIKDLSDKGVIFVENLDDVPDKSVLIFSAHGVSKKIRNHAKRKSLIVFDATCPLVSKIHMKVSRASRIGMEVILIGHSGHPEVLGTIGQYDSNNYGYYNSGLYLVESKKDAVLIQVKQPEHLLLVTQTTLSVDDTAEIISILRQRFPKIQIPRKHDICYATFNRQKALKSLMLSVEIIFIVGSSASSNSNRLFELAYSSGKPTYLINSSDDIRQDWLYNVDSVGITSGASTPDILIDRIIERLCVITNNNCIVEEMIGDHENVYFDIPKILINAISKNI